MTILGLIISPLMAVALIPSSIRNSIHCNPVSSAHPGSQSGQVCLTAFDPKRFEAPTPEGAPMTLPSGWWAIGLSGEVKTEPVALKRFNMDLVLWRGSDDQLNIFQDRCPHRSAKLSLGEIVENPTTHESCLQCPYHGLQFDQDGKCQHDPEDNQPKPFLKAGKIKALEKNGVIWMQWGQGEYPEPELFNNLESFHACGLKLRSKANIGLNIEGQLDSTHVPFVHKKSFWPIARSVMENKKAVQTFSANGVSWHYEDPQFFWQMVYPNVLINPRYDDYAMTIIYAPVDSKTTDLYIRSHRTFLVDPLIKTIVDRAVVTLYYYITLEDQAMALSQQANLPQYNQKLDKLYRQDDKTIRHFRAWLKGNPPFNNTLSNQPQYEQPRQDKIQEVELVIDCESSPENPDEAEPDASETGEM